MKVTQTIPTLRIFDEDKAREFYCGYLGFGIDFEHRFEPGTPLYMQVSRDGLTLHLSEHYGDGTPGTHVFAWTEGIDAYLDELTAKKYKYLRPDIRDDPWGRSLTLIDPFKNEIIMCEKYPDET